MDHFKIGDILRDDEMRPVKVVGFGMGTRGPLVVLERQDKRFREHLQFSRCKAEVSHYPAWEKP